jgi:polar amino acid transport system permease protein/octopine/nopaline transport system permease protein
VLPGVIDLHGFGDQLLQGATTTIVVAATSLMFGLPLGIACAAVKLGGGRLLRTCAAIYTTVIRGVPDLLIIFVIYFGGTVTLSKVFGRYVEVSAFASGVFALAVVFGAYATEIFRGAIQAVPRGQVEAANALGLSPVRIFALVILPQAWRLALPALGNQWLILLKQTSLVSVVGLDELMRKSAVAAGATREPFTIYLAAATIYLSLTLLSTVLLEYGERRANRVLRTT